MSLGAPTRGRQVALIAYAVLAFVFLYLPIAFLVLFSFNDHIIPSLPFRGFTLKWYRELGYDFVLHDALLNSLFIASMHHAVSTVLGTLAAFPLVRCSFRFKRTSRLLVILPMIIPHFLMGVALLLFFAFLKLPLSRFTIILGHVVFTLPFAILIVSTRLYGFDRTLELAAGDLGASPARIFWHVTLPLIMPGVVGAALLVFTLSMDEFLITYFVSGQKGTLDDVHLEPAEGRHRATGERAGQRAAGGVVRVAAVRRLGARTRRTTGRRPAGRAA